MSTNCLVTKFKSEVNNPNLSYFGMAVAYIDTTGATDNRSIGYRGDIRGLKILEGGTFADGTTEVTENRMLYVEPNKVLKVLYPKYKCCINPSLALTNNTQDPLYSYVMCVYDFNDLDYCEVRDATGITAIRLSTTPGGIAPRGDVSKYLACLDKTSIRILIITNLTENADITFNLEELTGSPLDQIVVQNQKGISGNINNLTVSSSIQKIDLRYCANVTGDRQTAFRNYVQSNPTDFKNRTDSLIFQIGGTNITDEVDKSQRRYQFTGTSTVDILRTSDQTKIGEYNIDTDTYTWL